MKTPDPEQPAGDDAWDDSFRQRLADYTDQPPADALNRILTVANPPRSYRRWAMGMAALLLLSTGSWFVLRPSATVSPVAVVAQPPLPSLTLVTHSAGPADQHSGNQPMHPAGEATSVERVGTHPANNPVPTLIYTEPPTVGSRVLSDADGTGDRRMATATTDKTNAPVVNHRTGTGQIMERSLVTRPIDTDDLPAGPDRAGTGNQSQMSLPTGRRHNRIPARALSAASRRSGSPVQPPAYAASFQPIIVQETSGQVAAVQAQKHLDLMTVRPFRPVNVTGQLPAVQMASTASAVSSAPKSSRKRPHPSWFISLTPLYNFQQIDPVHTDNEFVSNIQGARPLDTDRLSGRLQLGLEWSLPRRLSLRTSLVYQQMRQSLHYAVRSVRPDSLQVVRIDDQSVQVTPHFTERTYAESTVWHYAGLSSDLVWQLNQGGRWQHYLTAGVTAGRYIGGQNAVSGFGQVSYGVERPLTSTVWLRIEPSVQLGWQALTDRSQRLQSRPYNYGLSLGLHFR